MRRILITVLFLVTIPLIASALSIEDIKSQIQSILDRIQSLKTQIQNGGPSSTSATSSLPVGLPCLSLTRALSLGSRGDDVRELQKFLIAAKLFTSDNVTGYFGPIT